MPPRPATLLEKGGARARYARGGADLRRAQALRQQCFHPAATGGLDSDAHDALCRHVLIEDRSGSLLGTFRLLPLPDAAGIGDSYSAQHYDLTRLEGFDGPVLELGRFCIHPAARDADVLRLAWGALTRVVDETRSGLLFGCASFAGTRAERYLDAFAMLRQGHLAPPRWTPRVKAPRVFPFAERLQRDPDRRLALLHMPPLLRSYIQMGGWVSDHAVVDEQMDTLHVFTGLEIGRIPPARARALRAVAA
ncbi:GNAT family N-acetyltransferase [Pseudoroseicyclus aestuarii]|uniref:L-ornithine N(alpha)-acyltransferase n=1 Tax=Pseudoroseicyclus aestuarii TaxID=1795041 RepID=A0A318SRH4_9RHOB|nr:GNAT family N-acetyltransferase [Pseudoroseicyclus aestuarii]PYE84005.1 ornithine-acyl[acyl carrier protein] N-acyltransferase [Pseudoroseicyclus aestuarii]